jgi:nitrogen fixation/metabolism regulation signal transduction histidine kinase
LSELVKKPLGGKGTRFRFGAQSKIILVMVAVMAVFMGLIFGYILPQTQEAQYSAKSLETQLIIISLIITLVSLGAIFWVTWASVHRPLKAISDLVPIARALAAGDVDQDVKVKSKDEAGQVSQAFADIVAYLKEMAEDARKISEGTLNIDVKPRSDKDVLGKAFAEMVVPSRP